MAGERQLIYRFAEFTLEASEHRLRRGDREVYLRPKSFETLLYLLERHGRLVKKDDLLETLWAGTVVTEGALTHCIEEVRQALGDDAHHPRYIKTIPRVGFKFIADVEEMTPVGEEEIEEEYTAMTVKVTEEETGDSDAAVLGQGDRATGRQGDTEPLAASPARPLAPSLGPPPLPVPASLTAPALAGSVAPPLAGARRMIQKLLAVSVLLFLLIVSGLYLYNRSGEEIRSLAVLPFANLSAEPGQDYFADGMTEALITDLARIKALRVISRTSVMTYKGSKKPLPEIARELKVDAVVEGSVLRSGERVRITAQLIHAATDRHLWSESYERDLSDILALQSEVARAIVGEIRTKLTPQEQARLATARSVRPEAYQAYLKGRYFWNKRTEEGFNKGIEYFNQAIAIDPNYALAYVGLADCYNMLNGYDVLPPKDSAPKAKEAATKALKIDETLAEAHASLAYAIAQFDWDWSEAEREFKRAIELNPNYAQAHHWYALYLAMRGQSDEAMIEMRRAQELDPLSLIINANVGWLSYFARRDDQAIEQLQKTLEMDPTFSSAHVKLAWAYEQKEMPLQAIAEFQKVLSQSPDDPALRALLSHAYAVAGRRREAMRIMTELKRQSQRRYVSPYLIALIHAGLGEKDQAFAWLERAHETRCGWVGWLRVDPKLDPLRSDPRFTDRLRRLGLAP
jgi:TolB-like protein/DNA-binding winged helix-turn-helix (wHTH) protein/Tfp pilus assembly protein PilF